MGLNGSGPKSYSRKFPINPFPDVDPTDFTKLNKKRVTEDFVATNLESLGWRVYEPFTDTGIDRIIIKTLCSKDSNHKRFSENSCMICGARTSSASRFIQIKTRALVNGIFGFTLKSKDIRIDPRHLYLLYCDTTQDFFFVPVYDYLGFFQNNKMNPFASTSFRKGNNKLNSLRYNELTDSWSWGKISWEEFRNNDGLTKLLKPVEANLSDLIKQTRKLSNSLLIQFEPGQTYDLSAARAFQSALRLRATTYSNKRNAMAQKKAELDLLRRSIKDKVILESIGKYWEMAKNLELIGMAEEDETESLTEMARVRNLKDKQEVKNIAELSNVIQDGTAVEDKTTLKSISYGSIAHGIQIYVPTIEKNYALACILACSECGAQWTMSLTECFLCGWINPFLYRCSNPSCRSFNSITNASSTCGSCGKRDTLHWECPNPDCVSNTDRNMHKMINALGGIFDKSSGLKIALQRCLTCGSQEHQYQVRKIHVFTVHSTIVNTNSISIQDRDILPDLTYLIFRVMSEQELKYATVNHRDLERNTAIQLSQTTNKLEEVLDKIFGIEPE